MSKRDEIQTSLTKKQFKIYKECSKDILQFLNYVQILHKKKGWTNAGESLFPKQKKVLKKLSKNWEENFSLILSARQSGKTTIILLLVLWIITFNSAKVIGILANKLTSSTGIFRRFSQMYHKLDPMFKLSKEIGDSKTGLELADGTQVFCGPTSKSGLRSEAISLLILDEFAHVDKGIDEEFWVANYPTIEGGGSLIVTSTPNGKNNVFYDCYLSAKDPKEKKWHLYEIFWYEVFNRGAKWKKETIEAFAKKGQNGIEAFERECNNSFEASKSGIRFFNQDSVGSMEIKPPFLEWVPHKDYSDYGIKLYEDILDQHFIVGVDLSEGKKLNFSTLVGLSVTKRNLNANLDVQGFEINQAFHFMRSDILPDDFFDLSFEFLITQLNDQWYLIFENNEVGRLWSMRIEGIIEELKSGLYTKKNEKFKDILIDKFEGDTSAMIGYLTRRIYISTGTKGINNYGIRTDRKNNLILKSNMKLYIYKRMVNIYDDTLLHEMRLYEDKRTGGETITHEGYEGNSHFDNVAALKFALYPLHKTDLMQDIFNITALKSGRKTRDQQMLEVIMNVHKNKNKKKHMEDMLMEDNINQLGPDGVPVEYKEIKDLTSGWNRGRYKKIFFKK